MKELVFFLEEDSARAMLQSMLPRLLHPDIQVRYVVFEGKQDLEKQLPRRLRGYLNPNARFLVLRDQDSFPDCQNLKRRLHVLCMQAGRETASLIRIACRELEAFYLADLLAVQRGLGIARLEQQQLSAKFRAPDKLESPSAELSRLTSGRYSKVGGSRLIGEYLDLDNTRSASFRNLVAGIRRLQQELLAHP